MKKNSIAIAAALVLAASAVYFLSDFREARITQSANSGESQKDSSKNQSASGKTGGPIAEMTNSDAAETGPTIWYAMPFAMIQNKANKGDAKAQRMLSEVYEDCFGYNLDRQKIMAGMEIIIKKNPNGGENAAQRMKEVTEVRCANVDNGQVIPLEAKTLWLEQSAKSGDLTAQIRQAARSGNKQSVKDVDAILEKIKDSKDPSAVFEMGRMAGMLAEPLSDSRTSVLFEGQYAAQAWEVAACRAGYDCSANSRVMYGICSGSGYCNNPSTYDQIILQNGIPQGERNRFERMVNQITQAYLVK